MVLEISVPTGCVRVCVQARGCVSPVTQHMSFLLWEEVRKSKRRQCLESWVGFQQVEMAIAYFGQRFPCGKGEVGEQGRRRRI